MMYGVVLIVVILKYFNINKTRLRIFSIYRSNINHLPLVALDEK